MKVSNKRENISVIPNHSNVLKKKEHAVVKMVSYISVRKTIVSKILCNTTLFTEILHL